MTYFVLSKRQITVRQTEVCSRWLNMAALGNIPNTSPDLYISQNSSGIMPALKVFTFRQAISTISMLLPLHAALVGQSH